MALATLLDVYKPKNFLATDLLISSTVSHSPILTNNIHSVHYLKNQNIQSVLPFMVSITNIGIGGYSRSTAPGIGIQIIGYSNYIL